MILESGWRFARLCDRVPEAHTTLSTGIHTDPHRTRSTCKDSDLFRTVKLALCLFRGVTSRAKRQGNAPSSTSSSEQAVRISRKRDRPDSHVVVLPRKGVGFSPMEWERLVCANIRYRESRRWLSPAIGAKAEILAKERHDVILDAISHSAGVSAGIDFKTVRDSIFVENVMQLRRIGA